MTKMTDYDDNLYIITERAKLLEKSLELDIDPSLFTDQFKKDMDFIRDSLATIRGQLEQSPHTIKKPENLRNLMLANIRAEKLADQSGRKAYLPPEESAALSAFFKTESGCLEEILLAESDNPGEIEQVSMEEFEFLLKEPENPDEV